VVAAEGDFVNNSGETKVTVTVNTTNLSVTVPIALSIAANVEGGTAVVPNDYKITNNSLVPVKVSTIAVALDGTDWAFKGTAIDAGAAPTTAGTNDIYMTINGQVLAVQDATAPTVPTDWNVPAHNGTTAGTLDLPIVASTSKLDQTTTATDLITITYVISAQ
jgi:hypothetical protein